MRLEVYEIGKPLVVEEIFPISAGVKQTGEFIEASRTHVDGWISFYWGKSIEEYVKEGGVKGRLISDWLTYLCAQAPEIKKIKKQ
jgi:hypothetical protein